MLRTNLPTLLLLALLSSAGPAAGEDLPPEKIAEIQQDEREALTKINSAHGNKPPSEMNNDERLGVIEAQQSATQKVLEKHGVTAKEYARGSTMMSREDRARLEEAQRSLEARKAAQQKAPASSAEQPPAELVIRRGLGDEQPVSLDPTDEEPTDDAPTDDAPTDDAPDDVALAGSEPPAASATEKKPATRKQKAAAPGKKNQQKKRRHRDR